MPSNPVTDDIDRTRQQVQARIDALVPLIDQWTEYLREVRAIRAYASRTVKARNILGRKEALQVLRQQLTDLDAAIDALGGVQTEDAP